ncbi:MAG: 16S rRNA (uracil(1498)-N(3))-methyltransferase, partial [Pseudomonadota bacterium]
RNFGPPFPVAAEVSDVTKRAVTLNIADRLRVQPEIAPGPSLLFAPLKKTRTDFAVEKATELGASMICPVTTARTQTARIKPERLEALAMEAAEQTERLDVPGVADLVPLDQALDDWPADNVLIFCDEAGDDDGAAWGGAAGRALPMQSVLADLPAETRGGVLIGPEGGFSADERKTLRSKSFVRPVTLGPRILRAETAVVSALTIWQSVLGDWR